MVPLSAGRFVMGSNRGDGSERPAHDVVLSRDFAIGRYEVTVGEWQACVQTGGCQPLGDAQDSLSAKTPVHNVSWSDARSFANWLAQTTGKPEFILTKCHARRTGDVNSRIALTGERDLERFTHRGRFGEMQADMTHRRVPECEHRQLFLLLLLRVLLALRMHRIP